ncbi:unnamed protein product [Victoria cruziana]
MGKRRLCILPSIFKDRYAEIGIEYFFFLSRGLIRGSNCTDSRKLREAAVPASDRREGVCGGP